MCSKAERGEGLCDLHSSIVGNIACVLVTLGTSATEEQILRRIGAPLLMQSFLPREAWQEIVRKTLPLAEEGGVIVRIGARIFLTADVGRARALAQFAENTAEDEADAA